MALAETWKQAKKTTSLGCGLQLLVDVEIIVYQAIMNARYEAEERGEVYDRVDLKTAKEEVQTRIEEIQTTMQADDTLLCLGSSAGNWRRWVFRDYKANRPKKKPLGHRQLTEWIHENYHSLLLPMLEADDVIGIEHTKEPDTTCVVSEDKDFRSVPGVLFDPRNVESGVVRITTLEADRAHMMQTLTGDSADNYPGCRGIGPVKAARTLDGIENVSEMWEAVVRAYRKAGATCDDAIIQARVARILRDDDYQTDDNGQAKIRLWTPPDEPDMWWPVPRIREVE